MSSDVAGPVPQGMSRRFASCLAVLLLAASCATAPKAPPPAKARGTFILLPDDQGKTGAITVSGAGGERLLSKPLEAVRVETGTPPGESFVMTEKEVNYQVGPVRNALPPPPVQFILYFKHDAADLTDESRERMREVVRTIRERGAVDMSVVGHTDTVGDKDYNYRLSFKRAQAVAALLASEGVDPSILDIASHGKDNPLVPTGDQVPEPRNRRVEITVR
jgi:hypothetical protein